jgi:hypothetical protein
MSVEGIHAITSKFKERWLSGRSGQRSGKKIRVRGQKSQAPHNETNPVGQHPVVQPKPGTDEHFDHVMARSAAALDRTSYAAGNVEEASHAARMKRSGDILQNIRNTAAEHRDWSPLPEERHEQNMSRSGALLDSIRQSQAKLGPTDGSGSHSFYNQNEDHGWTSQVGSIKPAGKITPDRPLNTSAPAAPKPQRTVQPGLFGPSQVAPVRSPQQFGLAAKAAPAKVAPTQTRKPRVTQPGLFPKSAVKPPQ